MIIADKPAWIGPWVTERAGGIWVNGRGTAIGLVEGNEILAGVLFEDYNKASIMMHVAAEPGAKWKQEEFIHVCFDYVFRQLDCKVAIGAVASSNWRALKLADWLGFEEQARIADAHPGGDLVILAMHRTDCKWLEKTNAAV